MLWFTEISNKKSWQGVNLQINSCSWTIPSKGKVGLANIFVPRGHPAFNRDIIDDLQTRKSHVSLRNLVLGSWDGVIEDITVNKHGATLSCQHSMKWLTTRTLQTGQIFMYATAGYIAYQGYKSAFGGFRLPIILPGSFAQTTPLIPRYQFKGQNYIDMLDDLSNLSGQEWEIRNGKLNWIVQQGNLYPPLLTTNADVIDEELKSSDNDRAVEVIARGRGNLQYIARAKESLDSIWPRQVTIQVDSISALDLKNAADLLLAKMVLPERIISFKLRETRLGYALNPRSTMNINKLLLLGVKTSSVENYQHWQNIREGDRIQSLLRYAGIESLASVSRVLSRTYTKNDPLLTVQVQYIGPLGNIKPDENMRFYLARPGSDFILRIGDIDKRVRVLETV